MLRDSNSMLRADNDKHFAKVEGLGKQLASANGKLEPLKKKVKDFESQVAASEADKEALKKEVNSWKTRVQSLTNKYHQVDPADHTEALEKVKKLEGDLASAKTAEANAKEVRSEEDCEERSDELQIRQLRK